MRTRILIGAVIGMGVLIAIGLVVLIAGIVYKAGEAADPATTAPTALGAMRTDPVSLGLPAGAKVVQMTEVGGALALLVLLPTGEQVVYAVPLDRPQPPFRLRVTGLPGDGGATGTPER